MQACFRQGVLYKEHGGRIVEKIRLIEVKEEIQADNKAKAEALRNRLKANKAFLLNLMSSPGAGKTTLLLRTIEALRNDLRIGVIEADIDSMVDAEKIARTGITAVQLRTGGVFPLGAAMVGRGPEGRDM